jgi:uncharacterized protein
MPRVVHFELSADDPERAINFYRDVFGWKIEKWDSPQDYWLVMTGEQGTPGIDGGLMRRSDFNNGAPVINTIDVDSVDAVVARIEQNGGSVVAPKMAVHGVGYLAYCKDSEGNTFGVMQSDPSAG